jgi:hypothetical protein
MTTRSHHTGLAVIAVFKVVKGLLLLFLGLGVLKLVHAEIATLFSLLIEAFHLRKIIGIRIAFGLNSRFRPASRPPRPGLLTATAEPAIILLS